MHKIGVIAKYVTYRSTPRTNFPRFLASPQGLAPAVESAAADRDAVDAVKKQPVSGVTDVGRSDEGAVNGNGDSCIVAWTPKL